MVDIRERARTRASQASITTEQNSAPVSAKLTRMPKDLFDHLMDEFGSPALPEHTGGMDGLVDAAIADAEARGSVLVLAYIQQLMENEV